MKKMNGFILIAVCGLALSACSTFNKRECETMDWSTQGKQYALKGRSLDQGLNYFDRECRVENKVKPDEAAFKAGFAEGLKNFCTPESLHRFGENGGVYQGTCPMEIHRVMVKEYQNGRMVFLEKEVVRLNSYIDKLKSEMSDLESTNNSLRSDNDSLSSRQCP